VVPLRLPSGSQLDVMFLSRFAPGARQAFPIKVTRIAIHLHCRGVPCYGQCTNAHEIISLKLRFARRIQPRMRLPASERTWVDHAAMSGWTCARPGISGSATLRTEKSPGPPR